MTKKLLRQVSAGAILALFVLLVFRHFKSHLIWNSFEQEKFGQIQVVSKYFGASAFALILVDETERDREAAKAVAGELAKSNFLAVILNKESYLNSNSKALPCLNIGNDLIALSQSLQQSFKFKDYVRPLLIDLGTKDKMSEFSFHQVPGGSFLGLVSQASCSKPRDLQANLCKAFSSIDSVLNQRKRSFSSVHEHLPWLLIGEDTCINKVRSETPSNDIQFESLSLNENWIDSVVAHIVKFHQSESSPELKIGLPLVEKIPARVSASHFVILYSGDGGWAEFDENLANSFNEKGIPVVGIDSLKYFWKKRDIKSAGEDLQNLIKTYQKIFGLSSYQLVGFSFGADVMPFLIESLPLAQRKNIKSVSLLALSYSVDFEFHFSNWIKESDGGLRVEPQLNKLGDLKVNCLYGKEDSESLCAHLKPGSGKSIELQGGHHFDDQTNLIVENIE